MHAIASRTGSGERGSALVIAILVVVILTLLGVSFLLMAETENRIAENERLSAQALYFAEAGARVGKRWFDHPRSTTFNLAWPGLAAIDRTLRQIDEDGDPTTTPHPQNGTTWPEYKQGVDLNADGLDDVFDRPYRGSLQDTLLGTAAGPDMRIDEGSSAANTFLTGLSSTLMSNYPTAAGVGVQAKITRIDVYGPPYVNVAGSWVRYGMGTIAVTARIYKTIGATTTTLAERMVKAVLNETPYPGPSGPLQSCKELQFNGNFNAHWGTVTAVGNADLPANMNKVPQSIPRAPELPPGMRVDHVWGWNDDTKFAAYKTAAQGGSVEDPWYRFLTELALTNLTPASTVNQPLPATTPTPAIQDHSNLYQHMGAVSCPQFDYATWKEIATSGGSDLHYYTWDNGTSFKESGVGTAQTFRDITDNQSGFFFFDTKDANPPHDPGTGLYDNLTPKIAIQGGTYGVRGFVYLYAEDFQTKGATGRATTFQAPGEPFQDKNEDARYNSATEGWINLRYPTTLGSSFVVDAGDTLGGSVMRNARGPAFNDLSSVWGILYNNGYFDATGNAVYYGSVVSYEGVGTTSPAAGTPDLYWDQTIIDAWPPDDWDLPRVIVTRWETDL